MQIIFEDINVPDKELQDVVNKSMNEITKLHKKKKIHKMLKGCAAALILITAGVGICMTNPVLASQIPLIGHLFETVQDNQIFSGDYSKNAKPVSGSNVADNGGLKITLSEIYCNTEALNVTIMIESEEGFPDNVHDGDHIEKGETISFVMMDVQHVFDFLPDPTQEVIQIYGKYIDNHTYAGAFRINFNVGEFWEKEIPESFNWTLDVNKIYVYSPRGNAGVQKLGDDVTWRFDTEVSTDSEKTITKEINDYAPTGQGIVSVDKTPYEIILKEQSVGESTEKTDMLKRVILDADGNYMIDKVGMIPVGDHNVSKITVYYFPIKLNEEFMTIQAQINAGNEENEGLETYLQSISTYKIEIKFDK